MKNRVLSLFFLMGSIIIFPTVGFGCSLAYAKIDRFPKNLYVFNGEVIGYTDKLTSKNINGEAYGLKIKATDVLNAQKKTIAFYEVFPFGIEADCSPIGYKIDDLKQIFPIDSKLRVTAVEANIFPSITQTGQIRLVAHDVDRNDSVNHYSFSTSSIFDYAKSKYQQDDILQFELYKDLLRIEKAKTESSKIRVLKRLVYFQGYWLDFDSLLNQHLNSKIKYKLLNDRKSFLKEKFKSK